MCGIVGYVGPREASELVVEGLGRLEYRGYDSAGVAVINGGTFQVRRAVGKLRNLRALLVEQPIHGTSGIGHTRWATHGGVTVENAHPHIDETGRIVVIQNGIVENYLELKEQLIAKGHEFVSQTDTEVIARLLGDCYDDHHTLAASVRCVINKITGGNAIVALCRDEPGVMVAARLGNAGGVVIGIGEGEMFVASDASAIIDHTRKMIFLEDGEIAIITAECVTITNRFGAAIEKQPTIMEWNPHAAERGGYAHFMLKEIHEQPRTVTQTLGGRLDLDHGQVLLDELRLTEAELWRLGRISSVACGTAWHAALIGKYMIERMARVRVDVDYASEFRYRQPILGDDTLLMAITQSGETVDTLAAMEEARSQGVKSIAVVNAINSQAARVADGGAMYLHVGPEIGVASTKAFTSMVIAQYLLALRLAEAKGTLKPDAVQRHLQEVIALPSRIGAILRGGLLNPHLIEFIAGAQDVLYLGRGISYPVALEGALKLKEISYIHAEGYPGGEMKHGPIALVGPDVPVVCVVPQDDLYAKMVSNIEQIKARGGRVLAIATEGDTNILGKADFVIHVPKTLPLLTPVLTTIPLQLLAYRVAVHRGCDVDQPRNLAKSVTVE